MGVIEVWTSHRARGRVPGARWLLIASVLAGVFGMHVLGSHDMTGANGSTPATRQGSHAVSRAPAVTAHPVMSAVMNSAHGANDVAAMATPAGPGGGMAHSSMAGCILFLVAGAGLVLLSLLLSRHPGGRGGPARSGPLRDDRRRGPPASAPPRFSLCVLRV